MADLFEMILIGQQKQELQRIIASNEQSERFGLILSEEEAKELLICRKESLLENQRVEFGEGILKKLIFEFCDSQYINQDTYFETLSKLQEIFYTFKEESLENISDDELIGFMRKQFEEICFGDIEYLKSTCLERYTRAVRSEYQNGVQSRLRDEYTLREAENDYTELSEETRWEAELYKLKLEETY